MLLPTTGGPALDSRALSDEEVLVMRGLWRGVLVLLLALPTFRLIEDRTAAQSIVTTVPVSFAPVGIGVNPTTNRVYVANQNDDNVSVVDSITNTRLLDIPTEGNPQRIAVNPNTNRIYVTTPRSGFLRIIDGATNTVLTSVPIPGSTSGYAVAVNTVTNRVYVTSRATASLVVADGQTGAVITTLDMGGFTGGVAVDSTANRVYVVAGDGVTTLNGSNNSVITTFPTGFTPFEVAVNPLTSRLYVTRSDSPSGVLVLDTATNTSVTTIGGVGAGDVAVNPTTNRVYLPGVNAGIVILNGATNAIATSLDLQGAGIAGIAVNPTTNRVYASDLLNSRMFVIDDSPAAPTSTPVVGTATPTRTPTATNVPGTATFTPTVPTGALGGRGLGLSSGPGGVQLSWQPGVGQTGYSVLRLTDTLALLPPNGLGPNETAFLDTTAPPGLGCYALALAGPNPQRFSDALCALVVFRSATSSPQGLTVRLNQSPSASLNWSAPANVNPDGYLLVTLGVSSANLPATQTSAGPILTNGLTCFAVGTMVNNALVGWTDLVCGIPGFSNLGP
jgi:YVTN family beta-propeller protein